eukprot:scaffold5865_cov186-Amphora_coffeaeformis.AAC.12
MMIPIGWLVVAIQGLVEGTEDLLTRMRLRLSFLTKKMNPECEESIDDDAPRDVLTKDRVNVRVSYAIDGQTVEIQIGAYK